MRLRHRGQDSLEAIRRRLAAARDEIGHAGEYDYVIINERLDRALQDLACIVQAERLRMTKQIARHHGLVTQLGENAFSISGDNSDVRLEWLVRYTS